MSGAARLATGLSARPGLGAWLAKRSPRERLLLVSMMVAAAGYLAIAFVAQPLLGSRTEALAAIGRHDAALARLAALPAPLATAAAAPADGRPVSAVATDTAPDFGLAIRRIEPEGDGVRLLLEDADFAAILLWTETLERAHGLRLIAVEMDRRPEPGAVSARMTVTR